MTTHATVEITCPECHGSGDDAREPWRPCGYCFGNRTVRVNAPVLATVPAPIDEPPGREL